MTCSSSKRNRRPALLATYTVLVYLLLLPAFAFHNCIESVQEARHRRLHLGATKRDASCSGGLCVGMKNGPHEGGSASYPVAWDRDLMAATSVKSTVTVPEYPEYTDGITYYMWVDVFFGDAGHGRMNQLVPQLILGNALDGSSGPRDYKPRWGSNKTTRMSLELIIFLKHLMFLHKTWIRTQPTGNSFPLYQVKSSGQSFT
jgi:hypothetical protein